MLRGYETLRVVAQYHLFMLDQMANTDVSQLTEDERREFEQYRKAHELMARQATALLFQAAPGSPTERRFRTAHLPRTAPSSN